MNIGGVSSSGFVNEMGHNDIPEFTKPGTNPSQFIAQPDDGVDLFSNPYDDIFAAPPKGGGKVDCPEGTKPTITVSDDGQSVIVECKPRPPEKKPPAPAPILE